MIPNIVNDISKKSSYLIHTPTYVDLAFNVTGAGYFHAKENYLVERDTLKDLYLVIYTIDGGGIITYRNKTYVLNAGSCILINGMEYHHYYTDPTFKFWNFKWVRFQSEHTHFYDAIINRNDFNLLNIESIKFNTLFDEILSSLKSKNKIKDIILCDRLNSILTLLCQYCTIDFEKNQTSKDIIMEECRQFILLNYDKDISDTELAQRCFLTRTSFIRKFKNQYGITPYNLIIKTRLHNATILLERTNHSISNIAYSVGFSNQNNFAKQFKLHFNQTPTQYRNQFMQ